MRILATVTTTVLVGLFEEDNMGNCLKLFVDLFMLGAFRYSFIHFIYSHSYVRVYLWKDISRFVICR